MRYWLVPALLAIAVAYSQFGWTRPSRGAKRAGARERRGDCRNSLGGEGSADQGLTSLFRAKAQDPWQASGSETGRESSTGGSESTPSKACKAGDGDAPFTMSCEDLENVVKFPRPFERRPGGVVFLVHGTGSNGDETWEPGPFNAILPDKGPGYDVAWFNSPTRSLEDAQTTAEYIAYNVKRLAEMSATGRVFIVGHSQGNLNVQWALTFWPSLRELVSGFVSLAGDFRGTSEGYLVSAAQKVLQRGCEPSILQQTVDSAYLKAQHTYGGCALVPTTSLFTTMDDIIQPEASDPSSYLTGAELVRIQDICGTGFAVDHFGMTVTAAAFYITLSALANDGKPIMSDFDKSKCSYASEDATTPNPFATVPGVMLHAALDAIAVVPSSSKVGKEPSVRSYVERVVGQSPCS